jgi:phosphoenolpyruvate carboxylase
LGEVIAAQNGQGFYDEVEALRLLTRSLRDADDRDVFTQLQKQFRNYGPGDSARLEKLTKSFGLALELINVCENSYRSFRILHTATESSDIEENPTSVTWVFTAHPTEARTEATIEIFRRIQNLLIETLQGARLHFPLNELKYLLTLAWNGDLAPNTKPSVEDEARHILNITLSDESQKMLGSFVRESRHRLRLRTWVGGDKDGHPGVGAEQTHNSLQLSRDMILPKLAALLDSAMRDLETYRVSERAAVAPALVRSLKKLKSSLRGLARLKAGDGKRVLAWRALYASFAKSVETKLATTPEQLLKISNLLEVFPFLVMPLEMREDASVLNEIISSPVAARRDFAIVQMLEKVREIAGVKHQNYLQGFVISQCNRSEDFVHALQLVKTYLKDESLPVIPLFENRHALENAAAMVKELLANAHVRKLARDEWGGLLEVMVGYSDSAKEMGVLASRHLIAKTLPEVSAVCRSHALTPIFFHGSGGSISRGGGSTTEQCSWWPAEARAHIKMTVQGEMVQRSFASGPILIQNLKKLIHQNQIPAPAVHPSSKALLALISEQERHYRELVEESEFLKLIADATPYEYLQYLQIGSRPAKRKKLEGVSSLRAIPWVLCWTQTRALLPIWWGLGSAWRRTASAERAAIREDFQNSAFFASYVKQLGFSLAKVEPGIWRLYLETLASDKAYAKAFFARFEQEYKDTCDFVHAMSGSTDLLWFRPWLGASIRVRSPMIYPLHLAQLWALREHDVSLMRQTVTAIASGMLTTG